MEGCSGGREVAKNLKKLRARKVDRLLADAGWISGYTHYLWRAVDYERARCSKPSSQSAAT